MTGNVGWDKRTKQNGGRSDTGTWLWVIVGLWVGLAVGKAGGEEQTQPWQKPYSGRTANVIALWHFDAGEETADASGHGHRLKLRGRSRFVSQGKFGGCLESFPANKDNDKAQGAEVKNAPDLTPAGAFTLELWMRPKPELAQQSTAFLLDKKYYYYPSGLPKANHDYCLYLRRVDREGRQWRVVAYLGYGQDSAEYVSNIVELEPNRWYHVAFSYDGAGIGRFFLNGECVGRTEQKGRGAVSPGHYNLVIGDRYGSIHTGFAGYIDEVRISKGIVPSFAGTLQLSTVWSRTSFVRMETNASLLVRLLNDSSSLLTNAVLLAEGTVCQGTQKLQLAQLAPHRSIDLRVKLDCTLRPDDYPVKLVLKGRLGQRSVSLKQPLTVTIVPRPLPHQMPVVMWGHGDLKRLKEIGFTHELIWSCDYQRIWNAGKPTTAFDEAQLASLVKLLNEHLKEGIGVVASLSPGGWVRRNKKLLQQFQRIQRNGKPYAHPDICAKFPQIRTFAYNTGVSVARTFGRFPAWKAALIHTEVRDATELCFHEHDKQAFRKAAGFDIPAQAVGKRGVPYKNIKNFPSNRVIPDDWPLLVYYKWFWKNGDGWNELHSLVHQGLKSTGRTDVWTFFDPAVRVPDVWGSGGQVDVISQWTYSYPDPIKIGQAADELFAMAEGADHPQRVMKMTQIIWYRSQTAPKLPPPNQRAEWEKNIPDARFITIAPDHLREAFWSKISRPVQGIMYHGWGSLVQAPHGSYRFTNPKTRKVLSELIRKVVRPLGPTLLQVPDPPADVAVLESFASQMFAGRGTWGWSSSWEADVHLILQWAHLQPKILFDETVQKGGLKGVRVLVMPYCDVLTESVCRAVQQFQKNGGLVVADEFLCPAIHADITIPSYKRTRKADVDKKELQKRAAELRKKLDPIYTRYVDSSEPDVVVRRRCYGPSDYVFVVNDRRTFGNYVGHHRLVMEKGLPVTAQVSVRRPSGTVYDLVTHQQVPVKKEAGQLTFNTRLGPGEGRVFLVTETPIEAVKLTLPSQAELGKSVPASIQIVDAQGNPLKAVVPLKVEITDAQGRPAEFSGFYGAADGQLRLTLALAKNDCPGRWKVRVTELASNKQTEATFWVK